MVPRLPLRVIIEVTAPPNPTLVATGTGFGWCGSQASEHPSRHDAPERVVTRTLTGLGYEVREQAGPHAILVSTTRFLGARAHAPRAARPERDAPSAADHDALDHVVIGIENRRAAAVTARVDVRHEVGRPFVGEHASTVGILGGQASGMAYRVQGLPVPNPTIPTDAWDLYTIGDRTTKPNHSPVGGRRGVQDHANDLGRLVDLRCHELHPWRRSLHVKSEYEAAPVEVSQHVSRRCDQVAPDQEGRGVGARFLLVKSLATAHTMTRSELLGQQSHATIRETLHAFDVKYGGD